MENLSVALLSSTCFVFLPVFSQIQPKICLPGAFLVQLSPNVLEGWLEKEKPLEMLPPIIFDPIPLRHFAVIFSFVL